jgi:hypothetical protein
VLEPVAEKLIDFSDQNRLQLFDLEPLLLARVIQPEREDALKDVDAPAAADEANGTRLQAKAHHRFSTNCKVIYQSNNPFM